MRIIKFRALHKEDGFILNFKIDDIGRVFDEEGIKYCDMILMQFTGLRDKNGKEIYEGDIVKVFDSELRGIGKVVWNNDEVGFEILYHNGNPEIIDGAIIIEVIGNIYENPELLKGEKKK